MKQQAELETEKRIKKQYRESIAQASRSRAKKRLDGSQEFAFELPISFLETLEIGGLDPYPLGEEIQVLIGGVPWDIRPPVQIKGFTRRSRPVRAIKAELPADLVRRIRQAAFHICRTPDSYLAALLSKAANNKKTVRRAASTTHIRVPTRY